MEDIALTIVPVDKVDVITRLGSKREPRLMSLSHLFLMRIYFTTFEFSLSGGHHLHVMRVDNLVFFLYIKRLFMIDWSDCFLNVLCLVCRSYPLRVRVAHKPVCAPIPSSSN